MGHSVMLNADVDGDGKMEAVTSYLVIPRQRDAGRCRGEAGPHAVAGGGVSPAPFHDVLDIRFSLDAASPVRVECGMSAVASCGRCTTRRFRSVRSI